MRNLNFIVNRTTEFEWIFNSPKRRIMPSAPPDMHSVPLWLNAVQFIQVAAGSKGS